MSGTVCVAIGMGGQTGSWPCLSTDSVSLLSQRLVLVLALLLPWENPLHVSLPHVKQGSSPGAPWGGPLQLYPLLLLRKHSSARSQVLGCEAATATR